MAKSQSFELPVNVPLNRDLIDFKARTVFIDNYTNLWLQEKSTGKFIPPYWAFVVLALDGPGVAVIEFRAPGTIVQPAPQAGTIVTAIYSEDEVTPSNGAPVPGAPAGPAAATQDAADQGFTVGGGITGVGLRLGILIPQSGLNAFNPLTGRARTDALGKTHTAADVLDWKRPYDASGVSEPGAGAQASVVLAAVAGQTYTCDAFEAALVGGAGAPAANTQRVDVLDGATVVWGTLLGIIAGTGNFSRASETDLGIQGTINTTMTIQFGAGAALIFETLSIGTYLN